MILPYCDYTLCRGRFLSYWSNWLKHKFSMLLVTTIVVSSRWFNNILTFLWVKLANVQFPYSNCSTDCFPNRVILTISWSMSAKLSVVLTFVLCSYCVSVVYRLKRLYTEGVQLEVWNNKYTLIPFYVFERLYKFYWDGDCTFLDPCANCSTAKL